MSLFLIQGKTLSPIREKAIDLEKDLQSLTEDNLEAAFGLQFVATEVALHNFRIDTLAFDQESKAFVIIEYKRDKSTSVVDQGYSYLSLLLNNKAEFILRYHKKTQKVLDVDDVDWSQSRVLFLASSFTQHQLGAINFRDLPIELWEVKKYENDTLSYNLLEADETAESIKTVTKNKVIEKVNREIEVKTVADHLNNKPKDTVALFEELRSRILELDGRVTEKANKYYIGFQIEGWNFTVLRIRNKEIPIELVRCLAKEIDDPKKIVHDRPNSMKYYNQNISDFNITSIDDVDYAIMLIKQAYKKLREVKGI